MTAVIDMKELFQAIRKDNVLRVLKELRSNNDLNLDQTRGDIDYQYTQDSTLVRKYIESSNVSPLSLAIVSGKVQIVRALLDFGANVDLKIKCEDGEIRTPLELVCHMDVKGEEEESIRCSKARLLLMRDCSISSRCWSDCRSPRLIELLIHFGVDVNSIIDETLGTTKLHQCIENMHGYEYECIEILMERGADPFMTRKGLYSDHEDALFLAAINGSYEICKFLVDNFQYSNNRLHDTFKLLGCYVIADIDTIKDKDFFCYNRMEDCWLHANKFEPDEAMLSEIENSSGRMRLLLGDDDKFGKISETNYLIDKNVEEISEEDMFDLALHICFRIFDGKIFKGPFSLKIFNRFIHFHRYYYSRYDVYPLRYHSLIVKLGIRDGSNELVDCPLKDEQLASSIEDILDGYLNLLHHRVLGVEVEDYVYSGRIIVQLSGKLSKIRRDYHETWIIEHILEKIGDDCDLCDGDIDDPSWIKSWVELIDDFCSIEPHLMDGKTMLRLVLDNIDMKREGDKIFLENLINLGDASGFNRRNETTHKLPIEDIVESHELDDGSRRSLIGCIFDNIKHIHTGQLGGELLHKLAADRQDTTPIEFVEDELRLSCLAARRINQLGLVERLETKLTPDQIKFIKLH